MKLNQQKSSTKKSLNKKTELKRKNRVLEESQQARKTIIQRQLGNTLKTAQSDTCKKNKLQLERKNNV